MQSEALLNILNTCFQQVNNYRNNGSEAKFIFEWSFRDKIRIEGKAQIFLSSITAESSQKTIPILLSDVKMAEECIFKIRNLRILRIFSDRNPTLHSATILSVQGENPTIQFNGTIPITRTFDESMRSFCAFPPASLAEKLSVKGTKGKLASFQISSDLSNVGQVVVSFGGLKGVLDHPTWSACRHLNASIYFLINSFGEKMGVAWEEFEQEFKLTESYNKDQLLKGENVLMGISSDNFLWKEGVLRASTDNLSSVSVKCRLPVAEVIEPEFTISGVHSWFYSKGLRFEFDNYRCLGSRSLVTCTITDCTTGKHATCEAETKSSQYYGCQLAINGTANPTFVDFINEHVTKLSYLFPTKVMNTFHSGFGRQIFQHDICLIFQDFERQGIAKLGFVHALGQQVLSTDLMTFSIKFMPLVDQRRRRGLYIILAPHNTLITKRGWTKYWRIVKREEAKFLMMQCDTVRYQNATTLRAHGSNLIPITLLLKMFLPFHPEVEKSIMTKYQAIIKSISLYATTYQDVTIILDAQERQLIVKVSSFSKQSTEYLMRLEFRFLLPTGRLVSVVLNDEALLNTRIPANLLKKQMLEHQRRADFTDLQLLHGKGW